MKKSLAVILGVIGLACFAMEAMIWISLSNYPVTIIPPIMFGAFGLILIASAFVLFRER